MGSFNASTPKTIISYLNPLDHNLLSLPFVASENAETMDEVFQGTEEQLERTNAVVFTMHRTRAKSR
jgi:hypothetical protein